MTECDLLVVGSGAGGLSGAVTAAYHGLSVVVVEKAPVLGGATAWSGGWMWAPCNPLSQADGFDEDLDGPRTYLKHALGEHYDEPRVEALLQNSARMVAFFESSTSLQFVSGSWIPDIQGELPGAGTGGRLRRPKPDQQPRRVPKELQAKRRPQLYETSFPAGDHGGAGPAEVPARHDVHPGFAARDLAGRVPHRRPADGAARAAAGERARPRRAPGPSRHTTSAWSCGPVRRRCG